MNSKLAMLLLAATAALTCNAVPANAKDSETKPISEKDIKDFCADTHGDFNRGTDGTTYGCVNECNGGNCSVTCWKGFGCVIHVPGERRVPTSAASRKRSLQAYNMLGVSKRGKH